MNPTVIVMLLAISISGISLPLAYATTDAKDPGASSQEQQQLVFG